MPAINTATKARLLGSVFRAGAVLLLTTDRRMETSETPLCESVAGEKVQEYPAGSPDAQDSWIGSWSGPAAVSESSPAAVPAAAFMMTGLIATENAGPESGQSSWSSGETLGAN